MPLTPEQLLAEVEDVIRTTPPSAAIHADTIEIHDWIGRTVAVLKTWNMVSGGMLPTYNLGSGNPALHNGAYRKIIQTLREARHDLLLQTGRPLSMAIGRGRVYDYFEELRKIIHTATSDILFVDQFLNADFAAQYLSSVKTGVAIRLLTNQRLLATQYADLLPAVDAFAKQTGQTVLVRSVGSGLHDRYVWVDGATGYKSGASFKDGGKNAGTTIDEIIDSTTIKEKLDECETAWASAKVER
jgi:hypothetical protein